MDEKQLYLNVLSLESSSKYWESRNRQKGDIFLELGKGSMLNIYFKSRY